MGIDDTGNAAVLRILLDPYVGAQIVFVVHAPMSGSDSIVCDISSSYAPKQATGGMRCFSKRHYQSSLLPLSINLFNERL